MFIEYGMRYGAELRRSAMDHISLLQSSGAPSANTINITLLRS